MSKLTEKAKNINFEDINPRTATIAETDRPRTAVGAISASLALGRGVEEQNRQLKAKLEELGKAPSVVMINPNEIGPSRFANRHSASFLIADFAALKSEIESAGKNVQPIKVRPTGQGVSDGVRYEIVYGHRRHRACLELGLPVACIVEELTDLELFSEMERENRDRANLSAWEQGRMYRKALDTGLFPSIRKLAAALNVNSGNATSAIAIADLPEDVIGAFETPLDIQFRWAALLKSAVETNEKRVLAVCKAIVSRNPRPPARKILEEIVGVSYTNESPKKRTFSVNGKEIAILERGLRGEVLLKVKAGVFNESDEQLLLSRLEEIFSTK